MMGLTEKQMNLLSKYVKSNNPDVGIELGSDLQNSGDALLRILGNIWIEVMKRELDAKKVK